MTLSKANYNVHYIHPFIHQRWRKPCKAPTRFRSMRDTRHRFRLAERLGPCKALKTPQRGTKTRTILSLSENTATRMALSHTTWTSQRPARQLPRLSSFGSASRGSSPLQTALPGVSTLHTSAPLCLTSYESNNNQCLAQGHFDTDYGGARDRSRNLLFKRQHYLQATAAPVHSLH